MSTVAVLITSHNRREKTLACLAALFANLLPEGVSFHVIMVDDGSTDGTSEAVFTTYPSTEVIRGDGGLYWNQGMHMAFARAMTQGFDYYLWLNDDTLLHPDALRRLLSLSDQLHKQYGVPVIVVGSTEDPTTGCITYGGQKAVSRLRRFAYRKVWHATEPIECETMNGNIVLIPKTIACAVGNLDPQYEHAMGDIDYALRARQFGYRLFVAPGFLGYCTNNPLAGSYQDRQLPLRIRWKKILNQKGLPVRSWLHFTRRHGGLLWPLYFLWPYSKLLISGLLRPLGISKY